MQEIFVQFFDKHLDALIKEIKAYPTESALWEIREGISNSPGNLVCHLVGNLNHYIGHGIGETGYVRNRPLEFSAKDIPSSQLIQDLESTKTMIRKVLISADFNADYPEELFGRPGTVGFFMTQLLTHLTYHLGQINYHRRLLFN